MEKQMDQQKPKTARSYRGALIDDNYVLSLNIKWLGQICLLIAGLVYGYWQIEVRIKTLENEMVNANVEIENLLSKHIAQAEQEKLELTEKLAFYEKEFNINPLSWGKKKRGK